MSLKTTYKDDIFAGKKKYKITQNDDGSVYIEDITEYIQEGDIYSSVDVNRTNTQVNKNGSDIAELGRDIAELGRDMKNVRYVTIPVSGWSASAPYRQTVNVQGILSTYTPIVSLYLPDGTTGTQANEQGRAYGYVDRITTGTGNITLYCYNQKPASTFQIALKGE